jgi:hypothetical protein
MARAVAQFRVYPYQTVLFLACVAIILVCAWAGYNTTPSSHFQLVLYRVVVLAAELVTVAFIVVYTRLARWWRNPVGRRIVFADIAVGVALLPISLSLFFSFSRLTSELAAGLDLGAVSSIPLNTAWGIYTWLRLPRLPGQHDNGEEPPAPLAD